MFKKLISLFVIQFLLFSNYSLGSYAVSCTPPQFGYLVNKKPFQTASLGDIKLAGKKIFFTAPTLNHFGVFSLQGNGKWKKEFSNYLPDTEMIIGDGNIENEGESIILPIKITEGTASQNYGKVFKMDLATQKWKAQKKTKTNFGMVSDSDITSNTNGDFYAISNINSTPGGKVEIYKKNGTNWELNQSIEGANNGDDFGSKVQFLGTDRILISATGYDGGGTNQGAIYVYLYDGITWKLDQTLTFTNTLTNYSEFICVSDDELLIGSGTSSDEINTLQADSMTGVISDLDNVAAPLGSSDFGTHLGFNNGDLYVLDQSTNKVFVYTYDAMTLEWSSSPSSELNLANLGLDNSNGINQLVTNDSVIVLSQIDEKNKTSIYATDVFDSDTINDILSKTSSATTNIGTPDIAAAVTDLEDALTLAKKLRVINLTIKNKVKKRLTLAIDSLNAYIATGSTDASLITSAEAGIAIVERSISADRSFDLCNTSTNIYNTLNGLLDGDSFTIEEINNLITDINQTTLLSSAKKTSMKAALTKAKKGINKGDSTLTTRQVAKALYTLLNK